MTRQLLGDLRGLDPIAHGPDFRDIPVGWVRLNASAAQRTPGFDVFPDNLSFDVLDMDVKNGPRRLRHLTNRSLLAFSFEAEIDIRVFAGAIVAPMKGPGSRSYSTWPDLPVKFWLWADTKDGQAVEKLVVQQVIDMELKARRNARR